MNANKLADLIINADTFEVEEHFDEIIAMLRQQAKEIEELKKETPHILHTLHCTCGNYWNLDTYPPKLITKGSEK